MIAFEAVGRRYGRWRGSVEALAGVTLEVAKGRVTAVVGPNGAGKSTLFALALGFIGPTAGRVTIEGVEPRAWLRRHGAGHLPERFGLPEGWPVGRALRALARLEGDGGEAAAEAAVERWGLGAVAEREAGGLSRGTLQRVGLAQAMLNPHPLVVLDEPGEGLDPVWRVRLRDEIAGLRSAGTTVLLASHDLAEVERVADVVVLLDRGRVIDVMESGSGVRETGRWLVRLAEPANVSESFPGAEVLERGRAYRVRAEDAADLSARLAALLAAGAVVESVVAEAPGLEARVRQALEPPVG